MTEKVGFYAKHESEAKRVQACAHPDSRGEMLLACQLTPLFYR
jgi:hypothetical protein